MSNKRDTRIITINDKTIDEMTKEERDEYFKSFSGLTYAEWCEKYKNDTKEQMDKDLKSLSKKLIKHS